MQYQLYQELMSLLSENFSTLSDKPEETAETTLHALWHAASGQPRSVVLGATIQRRELDAAGICLLRDLVGKRLAGTPLAHITGRQHFMGLELLVGPEALIPRQETEILGNAALKLLRGVVETRGHAVVVDACCGSGNLAVALASHEQAARVHAADISPDAVDLARRNIAHMNLGERVSVYQGDLLGPFDSAEFHGQVDLLTCNPPYISSAKVNTMHAEIRGHEPREAFDGGPFGISILRRLVKDALPILRPGGWLAFEVGAGQGEPFMRGMQKEGKYRHLAAVHDAQGQVRAVLACL